MSDDLTPDPLPEPDDQDGSLREAFTKLVSTSVSTLNEWISTLNLPVQATRNAGKALGQLCSAAVDVPVAYLEGVAAEKRALTEARTSLVKENAGQIAEKMDVSPEYVHKAEIKFAQKIIKEQINLDKTCAVTMEELQQSDLGTSTGSDSGSEVGEKIISDDFLNSFEEEARHKSSEEMQLYFGRILAGEIRKPGAFSIRTLKVLGEVEQGVAILFKRVCSLCVVLRLPNGNVGDARVCSLASRTRSSALQKYGLNFPDLITLKEYGLIMTDHKTRMPYIIHGESLPFQHQGRSWILLPLPETEKPEEFRLTGVALSRAGCELFPIVDQDRTEGYSEDLKRFFASQNLQMVEVPAQNNT